ncbi:hypothetical protein [Methylobacterium sp. PvR107]|uniref:hypothetical protein n=1 Tax=Methylobacterium sp. PvR107 TaxID=2806597 RepID=UPI001AE99EB8|nr:hypothetical protein [Methylobacterium sp. PvR107]MBP1180358.1 4-hydroxy-L-threonine phosphate dehydrogenase PdxA [Methylobacterium sp. PvR107]
MTAVLQDRTLPVLALAIGDPAGVGPELAARAAGDPQIRAAARLLIIGDARVLSLIREIAGLAGSVAASVEGQGAATQDIVCHVADATAGTRAVTVTITTVAQAAAQTGAAAAHVLAAASDLSHHADALKTATDAVLVTVRAA